MTRFPDRGLVRHYAPFIRKYVREFCKGYPQLSYEDNAKANEPFAVRQLTTAN